MNVRGVMVSPGEEKTQNQNRVEGLLAIIYKEHWHILFTHFPVSMFVASALFTVLHFISYSNRDAYELGAFVLLITGTVFMLPTTATGWKSWKNNYHGAHVKIFLYKIRTAFAMIALSLLLVIWRVVAPPPKDTVWFIIYAAGIFLLFIGTIIEGYYGGKLNHH
jgi:uncharacterized membrane protein